MTVSHGVKVSLLAPRRVYPRNALIQVTLQVKNVSRRTVYVSSGLNAPIAYVLDSSGQAVYDPMTPSLQATVAPPWPVSSAMLYADETFCETSGGTYLTGEGWTATGGETIQTTFYDESGPGHDCTGGRKWHALAGWLNHAVAVIDHVSPVHLDLGGYSSISSHIPPLVPAQSDLLRCFTAGQ